MLYSYQLYVIQLSTVCYTVVNCMLYSYQLYVTRGVKGQQKYFLARATDILLIFSSDLPRNPRPFNFILLNCLILPDKTIFKESGHALMKY